MKLKLSDRSKLKNTIGKNIFLPIGDLLSGYKVADYLSFLQEAQYWDKGKIEDYQNNELRKLIHHAYQNVQYYKELFDKYGYKPTDINTKDDLKKLPILTKSEIKKNRNKFLAKNILNNQLIFSSSSGSTGEPFQFYKTKDSESYLKAALLIAWSWMDYSIGDKYVKISMNSRSSLKKRIQDLMNNCLYLSSTQISSTDFTSIAKKIIEYEPLFIRSYPVPLTVLASQIKENFGYYSGKGLRAINTTGSTLTEKNRTEIESVFKVSIYDSYSCEGGTVFSQCSNKIYHPIEHYAISEFLEDDFSSIDIEKPLRHITTDLHNYSFPFIRYDTQDYIVLGEEKSCSCGREYRNIKKIKGRDSDILITPSGKYLIVENFVAYFEWINEVDQIQIIQEQIDEITINLVVNESFKPETMIQIQKYWDDYIGDNVRVVVSIVNEILLTPTGKRRTVIRNPEISLNTNQT